MTQDFEKLEDAQSVRFRRAAGATLADVEALGIPDGPDRRIVLAVLLAARVGLSATPGVPSSGGNGAEGRDGGPTNIQVAADDLVGRLAARMGLNREVVELIYDLQDGELGVVLPPRRLASDRSGATRQLAQIVAGGRQAAGIEEWTHIRVVRGVVNDYGRLDAGNFAATVQSLDQVFLFRGKGVNRELKVTRAGLETVAELARQLASAD